MKKTIILTSLLLLPFSLVLAASSGPQGVHEPGTGQVIEEQTQVQNKSQGNSTQNNTQTQVQQGPGVQTQTQNQQQEGEEVQVQTQVQQGDGSGVQVKAQNSNQLKGMVQSKNQELEQEANQIEDKTVQKVYKNQNTVREAVQLLLSAEDLVGGIGEQVSEIAKEINNSVDKTVQAEEKIQSRNIFAKLFAGGDKAAAEELEQEVSQNKERIQTLTQLVEDCDCEAETKEVLQQQIQNMEQEQNRLEELAATEKNSNGIFGWLTQLFK